MFVRRGTVVRKNRGRGRGTAHPSLRRTQINRASSKSTLSSRTSNLPAEDSDEDEENDLQSRATHIFSTQSVNRVEFNLEEPPSSSQPLQSQNIPRRAQRRQSSFSNAASQILQSIGSVKASPHSGHHSTIRYTSNGTSQAALYYSLKKLQVSLHQLAFSDLLKTSSLFLISKRNPIFDLNIMCRN